MQRIDSVDGLFHEGNPATGQKGTKVTGAFLNGLQEEICNVIEAAGIELDGELQDQLLSGVVFHTSGVGRTLTPDDLITMGPWFDVRAAGAKGDGATDDAAAIRAAIAAGKHILIPFSAAGYKVGSSIVVPSGTAIIGIGCPRIVVPAGSNFPVFDLTGASNVTIKGVNFNKAAGASLGAASSGVKIGGASDGVLVEDITTDGFNSGIHMTSDGLPVNNHVFSVQLSQDSTGGTWQLGFISPLTLAEPAWTADLAYNADAAAVQAALEAVAGVGNVTVTGGPGPVAGFTVAFAGTLAGLQVPTMLVKNSLVTVNGGMMVTTITEGGAPIIKNVTFRRTTVLNSPASWGFHIDHVDGLIMEGCRSRGNWLDGVKLRKFARNVQIIGGDFSYNGVGWYTTATAGDGLDSYGGGERLRIIGASFNHNAGSGLQIKNDTGGSSGYGAGKYGLSRRIEITDIEASNNSVGNGLTITSNSTVSAYAVTDVSVNGGMYESNGTNGILLHAVRAVVTGAKARRNGSVGITVGQFSRFVELDNCVCVANGSGGNTGYGLIIDGKQVKVKGGFYLGVDADNYKYDTDPATLTKYHKNNINVTSTAADVFVEWPYEAHHDTANGRGIIVNAAATNVVVWQSPTVAGLVPGSSGIQGGPGSLVFKSDAVDASDRLWIKLSGANNATGSWKRLGGVGVMIKAINYTALASDDVITEDATGAVRTVTLPTAVGNRGIKIQVVRVSAGANAVIVAAAGGETINGAASKSLDTQWATVCVVSDGTGWIILSQNGTVN